MSDASSSDPGQGGSSIDGPSLEVSDDEDMGVAKQIVNTMVAKGVKVLALDFDRTIVTVHTHGFWRQGTPKLVEHVRPCFKHLIEAALAWKMHVCVVTYSMQPQLIHDILKSILQKGEAQKILIRANSKDWLQSSGLDSGIAYGKQQHIAWIVTELYKTFHVIIRPEEIILMDDDDENVTTARNFGHQAYQVPEDVTLKSIQSFVEAMQIKVSSPEVTEPPPGAAL